MSVRPQLRVIEPDATPEEVAAIVAAITASFAVPTAGVTEPAQQSEWVRASRLRSRQVGRARGPWRMSGRAARRARP